MCVAGWVHTSACMCVCVCDCCRRRVKSSQHIYEALFVNGEGSDVCIHALDHTWNLHKVMLRQVAQIKVLYCVMVYLHKEQIFLSCFQ